MEKGSSTQARYVLRAGPPPGPAPELDEQQRRVVDHPGGPLLVLAGPGTGKTTTLVEAVVERIERRGARPDQVLALTFSRKAADQAPGPGQRAAGPHDRPPGSARPSTPSPTRWCAATPRPRLYEAPLRLLSAPEQDVVLREPAGRPPRVRLLAGPVPPGHRDPRLRPRGARGARPGSGEGAGRGGACAGWERPRASRSTSPPGSSSSSTSTPSTASAPPTTPT
ncbi:UvrD-helicase domain-containing protein [Nocardioides convexus]|uniref:UvrD-helicase domain-containing protein n=1 Tax=Nocardioides convexus TaxID=2712224 RepID=UPI0024188593|nr:UvrD-helicase domain-containing protein [Nocardioides convexus]